MLKFSFPDYNVPPDGYRVNMADGTVIRAGNRGEFFDKIKQHAEWNNLSLPADWKLIYEDRACLLWPPGWCRQADGGNVMDFIDTRLHAYQIFHGAVTLANIVKDGEDALVPLELAESRAAICAGCPANINVAGCLPCLKISDVIMRVTGPKRSTSSDHLLRSCACCGCPATAAVHIKTEILSKAVSSEMERKFELCKEWCWQYKERHEQPA